MDPLSDNEDISLGSSGSSGGDLVISATATLNKVRALLPPGCVELGPLHHHHLVHTARTGRSQTTKTKSLWRPQNRELPPSLPGQRSLKCQRTDSHPTMDTYPEQHSLDRPPPAGSAAPGAFQVPGEETGQVARLALPPQRSRAPPSILFEISSGAGSEEGAGMLGAHPRAPRRQAHEISRAAPEPRPQRVPGPRRQGWQNGRQARFCRAGATPPGRARETGFSWHQNGPTEKDLFLYTEMA